MKRIAFIRMVVLAEFLSVYSIADYVVAKEDAPNMNNNYLSVRESLVPMFARSEFSGTYADQQFPIRRINPKAREYIRFYLEEDNNSETHICGAIWLLGLTGAEDDVLFIEQYIDNTLRAVKELRSSSGHLRSMGLAAGCFAGTMTKRHVKGAEAFVKKYATVSAWIAPTGGDTPASLSNARDLYSNFIVGAYQYSRAADLLPLLEQKSLGPRPYFHESFVDSLKRMPVDKYTELMNQPALPDTRLHDNMATWLDRYGSWIDMLLRKQTYAQWREAHGKQRVAPEAEKEPVDSFERIDMSETIEGAYSRAVARDAAEAFQAISRMLLDGTTGTLPIPREILQRTREAGLADYGSLHIDVNVEAHINQFAPGSESDEREDDGSTAKPIVVRNKETAAVTFSIQSIADLVEGRVFNAGGGAQTQSTNRDGMVEMQRDRDKWHWSLAATPTVDAAAAIVADEYLIESVRAAIAAYTQIAGTLVDAAYDPLVIPVLDNGELIPVEKRKRDTDEMAEALDMEREILAELARSELNTYGDYRIKVMFEATLGPDGTGSQTSAKPLAVMGYETADVAFAIRNTAGIFGKHAPGRPGEGSLDDEGNLRVLMKRINGKWYWNPFGW
jgi:hypothetical protein